MIRRKTPKPEAEDTPPKGFDDFDLRLGDIMRGERATMGKSLLDVQRELKIKATYIAAIENSDPSAFETPGFIAGYVRSYARYLQLDPEWAFETFCREADFATLSGLEQTGRNGESAIGSKEAAAAADGALGGMLTRLKSGGATGRGGKPRSRPVTRVAGARDPFAEPSISFTPRAAGMFSRVEPGAIGSSLVLLALIGAVGYGGWSVLQQVQRVSVAPVDEAPGVMADLDPLAVPADSGPDAPQYAGVDAATPDALDRLYRPQALDTPVMTPRDGPIAALDPATQGALAPGAGLASAAGQLVAGTEVVQRDDGTPVKTADVLELVATAPAWVRVQDAEGNILFEKTLNAGERWIVPEGDDVAMLRTGAAGALYFAMDGKAYGPAGPSGNVVSGVALSRDGVRDAYTLADGAGDRALAQVLAEAPQTPLNAPANYEELRRAAEAIVAGAPRVTADGAPMVELVAVRPSWVRVRAADGSTIYERTMQPGDRYEVPRAEVAATLRTGDAGAIYVVAAGQAYGPIGSRGEVVSNFALSADGATESLAVADLTRDPALKSVMVAENGQTVSE